MPVLGLRSGEQQLWQKMPPPKRSYQPQDLIVFVFAKSPVKLSFNIGLIVPFVICTLTVLISEESSALIPLQVPPGSIFDRAESSNGLGLDRYHSQSFQLDLC